eukprot:gene4201-5734_t
MGSSRPVGPGRSVMTRLMVHRNIDGALRYHEAVIDDLAARFPVTPTAAAACAAIRPDGLPRFCLLWTQTVRANGIELCFDAFGADDAEPMVMIMGLGAQLIHWDDDFCKALAACGFRVIRFDNRDIGLSTKMTGGKRITVKELLKLRFFGTPVEAPYTLHDMAADVVGLLDALGIKAAHVVGQVAPGQQAAVHLGVQRLHATV